MSQRIAIIDYGMGNLHSVAKAVEHVAAPGAQVRVTDDPAFVHAADRVVFPGQGAARDCMAAISRHEVRQAVLEAAANKPFLGICMGLQVLLEHSDENGGTDLLGLITGRVRFFGLQHDREGRALKIPHMGWNRVHQQGAHPLWAQIPQDSRFYFVHSYYVDPEDRRLVAGSTDYGVRFTSVLVRENLFAVQFHPEKSADHGLKLLTNFVGWRP
jgi:glutamine amidotransferase